MTGKISALEILIADGFERVTEWVINENKMKLDSLCWTDSSGWLYAFVINNEAVHYVGLTGRILRSRMDNYRDNVEEQTVRLRELITAELEAGRAVSVYGLRVPDEKMMKATEYRYRRELNPPWNLD